MEKQLIGFQCHLSWLLTHNLIRALHWLSRNKGSLDALSPPLLPSSSYNSNSKVDKPGLAVSKTQVIGLLVMATAITISTGQLRLTESSAWFSTCNIFLKGMFHNKCFSCMFGKAHQPGHNQEQIYIPKSLKYSSAQQHCGVNPDRE